MTTPLVSFYMQAYNSEAYIRESIESVLNQTQTNIELILVNNASTDKTGEICLEYVQKDKRIKYQVNELNTVLNPEYKAPWIYPEGIYYATIDSDDYLSPDFVEVMYGYAEKYSADLVLCGNNWITDVGKTGRRIPPQVITKDITKLASEFQLLYGSLRTFWGKLYRKDFYIEHIPFAFDLPKGLISGIDTFVVLRYLSKCNSFVSVNQALYNYRIHEQSLYNSNISVNRVSECDILYNEAIKLLELWGSCDLVMRNFLQDVHLASITDCMENIVTNTSADDEAKMNVLHAIVNNDIFCSYALNEKNWRTTLEAIGACVDSVVSKSDLAEMLTTDYFLVKLYQAMDSRIVMTNADRFALLLTALCHKQNTHLWGFGALKKRVINIPTIYVQLFGEEDQGIQEYLRNPLRMRATIDNALLNNHSFIEKKESLRRNVEANDLESAIDDVLEISEINPLDRDALYYKLVIAWKMGEVELSVNIAEAITIFWNDNSELLALCGDLYGALNLNQKALKLYESALQLTSDELTSSDITGRIKELSH